LAHILKNRTPVLDATQTYALRNPMSTTEFVDQFVRNPKPEFGETRYYYREIEALVKAGYQRRILKFKVTEDGRYHEFSLVFWMPPSEKSTGDTAGHP
jgi:hypothetical protein